MRSRWLPGLVMFVSGAAAAGTAPVIGGANAPAGKYPDAVGLPFDNNDPQTQYCSGTLIAPTVVITAGHCVLPEQPGDLPPDNVLVGTNSLGMPSNGETISVAHIYEYPDSQNTIDVALLVLATPSTKAPRTIATGWARADILNGASVSFVGYGAIDKNAMTYIDDLQEAQSTITDFDCSINATNGCEGAAMPDGELGAGGMGIDTCPGDSGGPMYLDTSYGQFLAGVTSRGYSNDQFDCSEGGIYERPDKIVDWIETTTGVTLTRAPAPTIDVIESDASGGMGTIAPGDPASDKHTYAVTGTFANGGTAGVDADGNVKVCPAVAGDDAVTVRVTDATNVMRFVDVAVKVHADAAATCNATGFGKDDGGCCSTGGGGPAGSIVFGIGVGAMLWRRKRC